MKQQLFSFFIPCFILVVLSNSKVDAFIAGSNTRKSFSRQRMSVQFLATVESTVEDPLSTIPAESKIILFDGVCNFCNTWVDILLRIDLNKKFKFTPLQSDIGKSLLVSIGKDDDDISSVILVDQDNKNRDYYDKSACVLRVVEELGPLAGVFTKATETVIPKNMRDSVYDMVAENRYNFLGKRDVCRCSDPRFADRFL